MPGFLYLAKYSFLLVTNTLVLFLYFSVKCLFILFHCKTQCFSLEGNSVVDVSVQKGTVLVPVPLCLR